MLGQSFFPGGDEEQRLRQEGTGPVNPVQEAIKILSLKLPRVIGANAPVPQLLLTSLGSGALPSGNRDGTRASNPLEDLIRRMTGGTTPPPPNFEYVTDPQKQGTLTTSAPQAPTIPVTGGGPRPNSNQSDLPEPPPMGPGRRTRSI